MILTKDTIYEYLFNLGYSNCSISSIRNARNFCAVVNTELGKILVKQKGNNFLTFYNTSFSNEISFHKLIVNEKQSFIDNTITPQIFTIDEEFEIITMEFLDKYKHINIDNNNKKYIIAYDLGKKVASVHNVSDKIKKKFSHTKTENYFRTFDTITPEMYCMGGPLFTKFIELMQRYPELNEEIKVCEKEFLWDCFIHGDLKTDNILLHDDTNKWSIKFIDWELVGVGDRYLDLGYIVGGYLLWWIENMKFNDHHSINNEHMAIVREYIFYFISGYQVSLTNKKKNSINYIKLIRFSAIFLLNIFYSKSFFKNKYSKQDIKILETAQKMLINPQLFYKELFMELIIKNYEKLF